MRAGVRILTAAVAEARAHLRGPVVLLALFAHVLLTLGVLRARNAADREQVFAADLVTPAGLVLVLLALVLPHRSLSSRRTVPIGAMSARGVALAALIGQALVLALTATGLLMTTGARLAIEGEWSAGREPKLGRLLHHLGPAESVVLARGKLVHEERIARLERPLGRTLEGRLYAEAILLVGATGGDPLAPEVDVHWRFMPSGQEGVERLRLKRGRPAVFKMEVPREVGAAQGLVVRFLRPAEHQSVGLRIAPGSFQVVGGSASAFGQLARSLWLHALAAMGIAAMVQWWSGFIAYPLAIAAWLTVLLFQQFAWPWLPGWPMQDPALRLLQGLEIRWVDLTGDVLRSAAVAAFAVSLPWKDPARRVHR